MGGCFGIRVPATTTGQPTGRLALSSFELIKPADATTDDLLLALYQNRIFSTFSLEYRTGAATEMTLSLAGARILGMASFAYGGASYERWQFQFEGITVADAAGPQFTYEFEDGPVR